MRRALAWFSSWLWIISAVGLSLPWRSLLSRTTVIAITGSVGKTTAKECLFAILAAHSPTTKTPANDNGRFGVPRTLLQTRSRHRFAVLEAGVDRPGQMIGCSLLVRPDVTLIVSVARAHSMKFDSVEQTAVEKAKLLRFARRRGVAVLNGDDPRVAAMAGAARGRVVLFGTSSDCHVRAESVTAAWPERLRFQVFAGEECAWMDTQLVGAHWLPSVLGAVATAWSCGVPLAAAADALRRVPPTVGRLQPASLPSGATMLRDDFNGMAHSAKAAFRVLAGARTARRVLVASDCTDMDTHVRHRLRFLARQAAEHTECAVFVGLKSEYAAKHAVRSGMRPEDVHHFVALEPAAEFLRHELRSGDLVLLKGRSSDHLTRLYFSQFGPVACWLPHCSKEILCDGCDQLGARPETGDPCAPFHVFRT